MGSIVTDSSGQVIGLLNSAFGSYGGPNISAGAAMIEDVMSALDCFIFDERQGLWTRSALIGGTGLVFVITRPNVEATLSIRYPSGRISGAKGLDWKRVDRNGFIRWQWTVGSSTKRRPNVQCEARVTIGSKNFLGYFSLRGVTRTERQWANVSCQPRGALNPPSSLLLVLAPHTPRFQKTHVVIGFVVRVSRSSARRFSIANLKDAETKIAADAYQIRGGDCRIAGQAGESYASTDQTNFCCKVWEERSRPRGHRDR